MENIPYPGRKFSDGTSFFLEGREQVEEEVIMDIPVAVHYQQM